MLQGSTFGFRTESLAQLLATASESKGEGEQPSAVPAWRQFLEDRLDAPLALDPDVVDSVPALLGHPCGELLPLAGRPLGKTLTGAGTSLEALEALRDYGKALTLRWEEGPEYAVATTIYYAAIATALIFHAQKIASRPFADLGQMMGLLASTAWMTPSMVRLFAEARRLCQEA